jgi:Ankyrin repeats (3 copies)/Ankyrin repeats (many copies)
MRLVRAIASDDPTLASRLLAAMPSLAKAHLEQGATRQAAEDHYLGAIEHYVYAGDTALHVAAAGYRPELARALVSAGADVSARNRLGAQPLHYAADGVPGGAGWNPSAQAAIVAYLIQAGADPDGADRRGVTPLHRAVRTRCAAAVSALLHGGADARHANGNGTTPMQLATRNTGRGGSGSAQSKTQQREIVRLLQVHGARYTPPGHGNAAQR